MSCCCLKIAKNVNGGKHQLKGEFHASCNNLHENSESKTPHAATQTNAHSAHAHLEGESLMSGGYREKWREWYCDVSGAPQVHAAKPEVQMLSFRWQTFLRAGLTTETEVITTTRLAVLQLWWLLNKEVLSPLNLLHN